MANQAQARLAQLVVARRHDLRHSKESAAREAGISSITWKRVEDGLGVRDTTYPAVERVLGWARGSVYAVLAGGEPTPRAPAAPISEPVPEVDPRPVGLGADAGLLADLDPVEFERVRAYVQGLKDSRQ